MNKKLTLILILSVIFLPNFVSGQYYNPPFSNYPQNYCECSSGPCCDGCHFMSAQKICDAKNDIQYGCPWGTGCGSDVGVRSQTKLRFCSGYSPNCDGIETDWSGYTDWKVAQNCGSAQTCNPGGQWCQNNPACYNQGYSGGTVAPPQGGQYPPISDQQTTPSPKAPTGEEIIEEQKKQEELKKIEDQKKKDEQAQPTPKAPSGEVKVAPPEKAGSVLGNFFTSIYNSLVFIIKSILKYWYIWLIILIPLLITWVILRRTEGGGAIALGYGTINAVSRRNFWLGVLGVLAIIFLLGGPTKSNFALQALNFLIHKWYFWFVALLIVLYFVFRIVNKSKIFSKYVAE